MKKFFLYGFALLLLSSCSSAEFLFDEPRANHDVSSADGTAHIDIPAKALPDGVQVSDLSIERKDAVTYLLGPDGTEFAEPVNVSVELDGFRDGDAVFLPIVTLVSDDHEEVLDDVNVVVGSTGKLLVQALVPHFSTLKIKKDAMMEMALSSPSGKFSLAETVPVKGHVKVVRRDSDLSNFRARVFLREVPDDAKLAPAGLVKVISREQELAFDELLPFSSTQYVCNKEGDTYLKVLVPVRFDIGADYKDFLYKFYIYSDSIECVNEISDGGEGEGGAEEVSTPAPEVTTPDGDLEIRVDMGF